MKVVLLDDNQRKKIINTAKPSKRDFFSYQNLNLLTAVSNEKNVFLTLSSYISSAIARTGDNSDEYKYVLLSAGLFYRLLYRKNGKNRWNFLSASFYSFKIGNYGYDKLL